MKQYIQNTIYGFFLFLLGSIAIGGSFISEVHAINVEPDDCLEIIANIECQQDPSSGFILFTEKNGVLVPESDAIPSRFVFTENMKQAKILPISTVDQAIIYTFLHANPALNTTSYKNSKDYIITYVEFYEIKFNSPEKIGYIPRISYHDETKTFRNTFSDMAIQPRKGQTLPNLPITPQAYAKIAVRQKGPDQFIKNAKSLYDGFTFQYPSYLKNHYRLTTNNTVEIAAPINSKTFLISQSIAKLFPFTTNTTIYNEVSNGFSTTLPGISTIAIQAVDIKYSDGSLGSVPNIIYKQNDVYKNSLALLSRTNGNITFPITPSSNIDTPSPTNSSNTPTTTIPTPSSETQTTQTLSNLSVTSATSLSSQNTYRFKQNMDLYTVAAGEYSLAGSLPAGTPIQIKSGFTSLSPARYKTTYDAVVEKFKQQFPTADIDKVRLYNISYGEASSGFIPQIIFSLDGVNSNYFETQGLQDITPANPFLEEDAKTTQTQTTNSQDSHTQNNTPSSETQTTQTLSNLSVTSATSLSSQNTYRFKQNMDLYTVAAGEYSLTGSLPAGTPIQIKSGFTPLSQVRYKTTYEAIVKKFQQQFPTAKIENVRLYSISYGETSSGFIPQVFFSLNGTNSNYFETQGLQDITPANPFLEEDTKTTQAQTTNTTNNNSTTTNSQDPHTQNNTPISETQTTKTLGDLSVTSATSLSSQNTYRFKQNMDLYTVASADEYSLAGTLPADTPIQINPVPTPLSPVRYQTTYNAVVEKFKKEFSTAKIERVRLYNISYGETSSGFIPEVIFSLNGVNLSYFETQGLQDITPANPFLEEDTNTTNNTTNTETPANTSSSEDNANKNPIVTNETTISIENTSFIDLFAPLTSNPYSLSCRFSRGKNDIKNVYDEQGNFIYVQLIQVLREAHPNSDPNLPLPKTEKPLTDYCEELGGQMVQRIKLTTNPKEMIEWYFQPLLKFLFGIFLSALVGSLIYAGMQYIIGSGDASFDSAKKWVDKSMWALFLLLFMQAILAMINPVFFGGG